MNDIKNNIIAKIKAGEVEMRPRWQFVLRAVLLILVVAIVACIATYLLSFVLFALRQSGILFAPLLGFRGVVFFVVMSPWLLLSLVGLFLGLLYVLVTHFSFSYRRPLVYSMIGVALFVIGTSSFIEQCAFHDRLHVAAMHREMPGLSPLYRDLERRPDGVVVGTISSTTRGGYLLITESGDRVDIIVSEYTKRPGDRVFREDEEIMVFGERSGYEVAAFGIRPLPDNARHDRMPRPRGMCCALGTACGV